LALQVLTHVSMSVHPSFQRLVSTQ
jgi:hypothetical protein